MKKILVLALISVLCSSMFGIDAKVISVSGKVQVQRNNNWIDLKPNDVIRKGEMIQTGFKSEAQIAISSSNQNSKLTVAQLSRLTIEQLVEGAGADKASVFIQTGSVKSEIKKTTDRRASYTVRGPVATASVRGTVITMTNGFDCATLNTEQGNASFYPTAVKDKKPSVSSDQDDKAFASLSAEQVAVTNIYSAATSASLSVKAGQSSSVAGNQTVSVRDSLAKESSNLSAGTSSMAASEIVSAEVGDKNSTSSKTGDSIKTASVIIYPKIEW